MKKEFLECGLIRSPHGVRGILNVESWCDSPRVLASLSKVYTLGRDGSYTQHEVISASQNKDMVLMGLSGVASREDAQALKNTVIYARREDIPIPPGAMLIADMLGRPVVDVYSGRVYGNVSDVRDGVRYKLYTVKTENGEVILPGVDEFVKEISEERGLLVRPIPGFFD